MKRLVILLALLLSACAFAEAVEAPRPAGYVLVSTATQSGWLALPTEGERLFPLSQVLPDGTEALNVIHMTPDGVCMEEASCANQDCVGQGKVTLENIPERILGNAIICLPNQLVLQLYSADEVLAMFGALPEMAESDGEQTPDR